jgi:electron-transferring-flavoprotein dehydrogenase
MKSGMLAAEAVAEALAGDRPAEPVAYEAKFRSSWLWSELRGVRNIRPAFSRFGLYGGIALSAIDTYVFRGKAPRHKHPDHEALKPATSFSPIEYPKPDGKLTFDRLSSVFVSNTNHEEDQPVHLRLRDPARWEGVNWAQYASPESRYCAAAVYEAVEANDGRHRLQINAQNRVHCKTCDIQGGFVRCACQL